MRARPPSIAVALVLVCWATSAFAVKYLTLGEAVQTFVPKGAKVFKVTKKLTPEQVKRVVADYGWQPGEPEYVFYEGRDAAGAPQAYVYVVPEVFGTCFHKYAVGLKPSGEIIDAVVVELSCPRSFKVNRQSFLKQLQKKKHSDALTTKLDVDAVTEATLSSESVAQAARKAVSLFNVLIGPDEKAAPSKKVRDARASGQAMIRRAVETGETMAKDGGAGAAQASGKAE